MRTPTFAAFILGFILSALAAMAGPTITYPFIRTSDEGSLLTQRPALDFTGAGVACVDDSVNNRTQCTITGGAAGKVAEAYMADASITSETAAALAANPADCPGGQYATGIAANGDLTCSVPPGAGGKIAEAYMADASITAQAFEANPADCAGGEFATSIAANGDLTCAAPPAGIPGGGHGSLQFYSDAGGLGGTANVSTDGTDLVFIGSTTHSTAPATGKASIQAFQHAGSASPATFQSVTPELNFDISLDPRPFARSDEAAWGCVIPGANGSATYTPSGRAVTGGATGTAAAVSWAATDARTRMVWVQHPAAATTNTNAGYRANVDYFWGGNDGGLGGFYWQGSFALPLTTTTTRVFAGIKDATTVMTATSDPNVTTDCAYFGCNAADSNLSVCSNDNTSTATCSTLGAGFPCHTNNSAYDIAFWQGANRNGNTGTIGYWIRNILSGEQASGTLSSDLPRTDVVKMGWEFTANTGSTASAVQMHVGGSCWWANN